MHPKKEDLELLQKLFPHIKCICELCDCGQHKHHRNCTKGYQRVNGSKFPTTSYREMFKDFQPSREHLKSPTTFQTSDDNVLFRGDKLKAESNQAIDFVSKSFDSSLVRYPIGKGKLVEDSLNEKDGHMDFLTEHKYQYAGSHGVKKRGPANQRDMLKNADDKRSFLTTSMESFKWATSERPGYSTLKRYELANKTFEVMYPERAGKTPSSTCQSDFSERCLPADMFSEQKRLAEKMFRGNISIEGSRDMNTTTRMSFVPLDFSKRTAIRHDRLVNQRPADRPPLQSQTRYQSSFRRFDGHRPEKPVSPPPENQVIQLDDNKRSLTTETATEYKQFATENYSKQKVKSADSKLTEKDEDYLDSITMYKQTFVDPINGRKAAPVPQKTHFPRDKDGRSFDTTANSAYKSWPNVRNVRTRPRDEFQESVKSELAPDWRTPPTTNMDQFSFKAGPQPTTRPAAKPKEDNSVFQVGPNMDLQTIHRDDFRQHKRPKCHMTELLKSLLEESTK